MLRQEVHILEIEQQSLKRNLNELQNHRLGDRIRSLEIEQRRLASSNFNLSRQVANLDKLHSSMLELLEDIEGLQNKVDKTIPDIKREISKMEFTSAQTASEQNFLKEESHNIVKNIQALSVSLSSLQDDRLNTKAIELELKALQNDIEVIRSAAAIHKEIAHSQINKVRICRFF